MLDVQIDVAVSHNPVVGLNRRDREIDGRVGRAMRSGQRRERSLVMGEVRLADLLQIFGSLRQRGLIGGALALGNAVVQ